MGREVDETEWMGRKHEVRVNVSTGKERKGKRVGERRDGNDTSTSSLHSDMGRKTI